MKVNRSNQLAVLSQLFLVCKPTSTRRCHHMNSNIDKNVFLLICFYKDMLMPGPVFLPRIFN